MSDQGKTIAIVSHITFIGWIVAIIMHNSNKTDLGAFYIRQTLGIFIFGVVGGLIPLLNLLIALAVLAALIYSLIGAVNMEKRELPGIGPLFQDWFKSI